MASTYPTSGRKYRTNRKPPPRRQPASQGHPTRGGTSVGGGTGRRPIVPYESPTPSIREQRREPAPKPDVTLRGDQERRKGRTGHTRSRLTYEQELAAVVRNIRASRKKTIRKPPPSPGLLEQGLGGALDATLGPLASLGAEVGFHTGKNLIESGDVRRETLKGVRDIPAGLVAGVAGAFTDPIGTAKEMGEQYKRTYGPAIEGDWDAFKRVQEEEGGGGALQVLSDGTIVVGGASLALGKLARRGALGKRAKETMTAPRPRLRYLGGDAREQEISPFYFAAKRQRRRDKSRTKVYERRIERAFETRTPGPAVRPGPGEVVSRGGAAIGGRVVAPLPGVVRNRMARRAAAGGKAQRRIGMLAEQVELDRLGANTVGRKHGKRFGNLTQGQQLGFRYAYGGLMSALDPGRALGHLRERREQIVEERALAESKGRRVRIPLARIKHNDELLVIDDLIARIEGGEALTGDTLKGAARTMRRAEISIARGRPDLQSIPDPGRVGQAQLRRYMPQAEFLARMDERARAQARREGRPEPEGGLPAMRKGEPMGSYVERVGLKRVIARARQEGLERPGYFPSERRFRTKFGDRGIGGAHGLLDDRTYTGMLFRTGREDTRPEVLLAGLTRGIKRKHSINLMAEQIERGALRLGPSHDGPETARKRREATRVRQRTTAEERIARDLGLDVDEFREVAESLARERADRVERVASVYMPKQIEMKARHAELSEQIDVLDEKIADLAEGAFREELVDTARRLDDAIEARMAAGDLEGWQALRAERLEVQNDVQEAIDAHVLAVGQSNRLHAEREIVEEDLERHRVDDDAAPLSGRQQAVLMAEADLRTAHEGLRLVRTLGAEELLEDALKVVDAAEGTFKRKVGDARDEVVERAGTKVAQAAHDRLARDSIPGQGRSRKEIIDDMEDALMNPDDVGADLAGAGVRALQAGRRHAGSRISGRSRWIRARRV